MFVCSLATLLLRSIQMMVGMRLLLRLGTRMNFSLLTQIVMVWRFSYFVYLWYQNRLGSSSMNSIILILFWIKERINDIPSLKKVSITLYYPPDLLRSKQCQWLQKWHFKSIIIRHITMDPRRLCHISDLPNNLHFLPIEIKHLLPVHHSKFIDNLLTILANQAHNLHWPIYMDQSLTLSSSNYASTFGGWCEDIDGQQHHLKATLQLSAIILNYLHSLIVAVPAEKEAKMQLKVIQRMDFASDEGPIYANEQSIPVTTLLAYNIYKTRDKQQKTKFIFMVGRQFQPQLRLFSMASSLRYWNLHRLKSQTCSELTANRCHRLIEHLVIIFRGFLSLQELDNQIKRRELQMLLEAIDQQKILTVAPKQAIEQQYTVISHRFQWNYKESQLKKDLFSFCAEAFAHIIKMMPRNMCCSYAGRVVHTPKMNQIILLWLTTHKKAKASRLTFPLNEQSNEEAVKKCLKFMQKKSVENIRDGGVNIADEMLKSSLKVLNKYTNDVDRSMLINPSSSSSKGQMSDSESIVTQRYQRGEFDRLSGYSKISFKSRGFQKSAKELKNSHFVSQNFQSLSSPLMIHRDREYAQLLQILQQWQKKYGKIYPWTDIRSALRRNCENAFIKYGKSPLTAQQSILLLSFIALKNYLDVDQLSLLVKNYVDFRESIFEVIFQKSNAQILLDVAKKLAKDGAQQLYETYLTKDFRVDRNSALVTFLKRYLVTFELNVKIRDLGDRISVPVLLDILDKRDYASEAYREMISSLLQEIFIEDEPLRLISPVIHEIYLNLVEDHHEELVNSLIGDIAFEVLYYSYDSIYLSNSPYRREQDLKQKKLLEILREGGFSRLGFQLKQILKPIFFRHCKHNFPQARIYEQIIIQKPIHIVRFMELLIQSQITQHFLQLGKFYKSLLRSAQLITRPIGSIFLCNEVTQFRYEVPEERVELAGSKSESGIFQHLLNYNPQLKIAGMSLSQILEKRESEKKSNTKDRFSLQYVLKSVLLVNLEECYEYILMVLNLKEKYVQYDALKEEEKIYLREIMHQVLCRKTGIYQYLELDAAIKLAQHRSPTAIY